MKDEKKSEGLTCEDDGPSIFDDLEKLKADSALPEPARRAKDAHLFARIPYDLTLAIYKRNPRLSMTAWVVLCEIDRLVLKRRGQNPIALDSDRLCEVGIRNEKRARALRELVDIGMIKVESQGRGRAPIVAYLLYPLKE